MRKASAARSAAGTSQPAAQHGSAPPSSSSASAGRRRGSPAGHRGLALSLVVLAAIGLLILVLALSGTVGSSAGVSATQHSAAKYGGLPAWLPKPKVQMHRVLRASAAHPALSIEGEGIEVGLVDGTSVLVTAVGPEVPEEGRFPVPQVTPVTFIVTFAHATRSVPLERSTFALIDERGTRHRPSLTGVHGGPAPSQVAPGHPVSVELHDILPTGDGALAWTPQGARPLASWDFTVEID